MKIIHAEVLSLETIQREKNPKRKEESLKNTTQSLFTNKAMHVCLDRIERQVLKKSSGIVLLF